MKNKKDDKQIIVLDDVNDIQADPCNLEEQGLFEFIKNKIAENLEVNISISKDRNTGKINLSFSAHYDDSDDLTKKPGITITHF